MPIVYRPSEPPRKDEICFGQDPTGGADDFVARQISGEPSREPFIEAVMAAHPEWNTASLMHTRNIAIIAHGLNWLALDPSPFSYSAIELRTLGALWAQHAKTWPDGEDYRPSDRFLQDSELQRQQYNFLANERILSLYGWTPQDRVQFLGHYGRYPYRIDEELETHRPVSIRLFGAERPLYLGASHYDKVRDPSEGDLRFAETLPDYNEHRSAKNLAQYSELSSRIEPSRDEILRRTQGPIDVFTKEAFEALLCVRVHHSSLPLPVDVPLSVAREPALRLKSYGERGTTGSGQGNPDSDRRLNTWLAAQPRGRAIRELSPTAWAKRLWWWQPPRSGTLETAFSLESASTGLFTESQLTLLIAFLEKDRSLAGGASSFSYSPTLALGCQGLIRFRLGSNTSVIPTNPEDAERFLALLFANNAFPSVATVRNATFMQKVRKIAEVRGARGFAGAKPFGEGDFR